MGWTVFVHYQHYIFGPEERLGMAIINQLIFKINLSILPPQ